MPFREIHPSPELLHAVLVRIHARALRRLQIRFAAACSVFVACIAAFVSGFSSLRTEIEQSSLIDMLRLAVTDSDIVFQYTKDLGLGILESIPWGVIVFFLLFALSFLFAFACLSALLSERQIHTPQHSQ